MSTVSVLAPLNRTLKPIYFNNLAWWKPRGEFLKFEKIPRKLDKRSVKFKNKHFVEFNDYVLSMSHFDLPFISFSVAEIVDSHQ